MASSFLRFLDHTQWGTTVSKTPLDEWSARRRDLNLTTYNTHNRQTPITPVGLEPTISAGRRPQTYALDRAAAGTCGSDVYRQSQIYLPKRHVSNKLADNITRVLQNRDTLGMELTALQYFDPGFMHEFGSLLWQEKPVSCFLNH